MLASSCPWRASPALETETAARPLRVLWEFAPVVAFALLSAVAGASLAHAVAAPLWIGAVVGFAAGCVPVVAVGLKRRAGATRLAEQVALALPLAVVIAVAVRGMWTALAGNGRSRGVADGIQSIVGNRGSLGPSIPGGGAQAAEAAARLGHRCRSRHPNHRCRRGRSLDDFLHRCWYHGPRH